MRNLSGYNIYIYFLNCRTKGALTVDKSRIDVPHELEVKGPLWLLSLQDHGLALGQCRAALWTCTSQDGELWGSAEQEQHPSIKALLQR